MSETITTATGPVSTIDTAPSADTAADRPARGGAWDVIVLGSAMGVTVLAILASLCTLGIQ